MNAPLTQAPAPESHPVSFEASDAADRAIKAMADFKEAVLQLYPQLRWRIYGEDPLPENSSAEVQCIYEDLDIVARGIGAAEEIKTWLCPLP